AAIVRPPETNKGAIAKGKIDGVLRADTKAPEAITPHLSNPLPILHTIKDTNRRTSGGARCEMIADGIGLLSGEQIAEHGGFNLRIHPLLTRHKRNATNIIERLELPRFEASSVEAFAMKRRGSIGPLAQTLQFEQLQRAQFLAR